jgi:hemerythrin-like metal-binding protein
MEVTLPTQIMTGIPGIDHQHQALIHWARTMNTVVANGANRGIVKRAAQFLIAYVKFHFASEEYAMVATCYDGVARHSREHAMMRRQLARLSAAINANSDDAGGNALSLQRLIQGWIQNHISDTDMDFAGYCSQQPEPLDLMLPSPQELREAGFKVSHIDQVEAVHQAGEISAGELKARLKIRD